MNSQYQMNIYALTSAGTHPLKAKYQIDEKIKSWVFKPATPAQQTIERFIFGRQPKIGENLKYFYIHPVSYESSPMR